jgi:para-aminobenzoate synthetase
VRVLLIDNYDSYTYNLAQLLAQTYGQAPDVVYNDSAALLAVKPGDYDAIVVSPGPGRPQVPGDLGHVAEVLRTTSLPVLGVCLGHQAIGYLSGAWVGPAPRPQHGFVDRIRHLGTGLFAGLPQNFAAVRYHSLCVRPEGVPDLAVTAWTGDDVVMALAHRSRPWWGVQFHPESIGTEYGARLLGNFAELARGGRRLTVPEHASAGPGPAVPPAGRWRLTVRILDFEADPQQLYRRWPDPSPSAFWLDSSRVESGLSRFSFLGDAGGPHGETLRYEVGSGRVRSDRADGSGAWLTGSIYDVLRARLRERALADDAGLPFDLDGGYVGYLGYEMKAESTGAAAHRSALPDAVWLSATRFVAIDHQERRTYVAALVAPGEDDAGPGDRWADATAAIIASAGSGPSIGDPGGPAVRVADVESWLGRDRERYLADIAECQRLLRSGESYEICLTNAVRLAYAGDPFAFYSRQRLLNAAPYAAFLQWDGYRVACSSPERFLRVTRDRTIESKPIKGTAARHPDPDLDRLIRDELARDPKTRAENMMIVDLLRNDLGQVCDIGTVEVPRFMAVESYTTMHQLVSTVRGKLRSDVDTLTALRHCFPGGSMTGAPKIRTMEIIDRLEGTARGIYSGSLGYFALSGACDLNIVIRTAVFADGELSVGAGGAIVLDSEAGAEYDEMLLKALAPLRPLLADEPAPQPR